MVWNNRQPTSLTHSNNVKSVSIRLFKADIYAPEVTVFLKGKLLSDVTLLLSADRATEGKGVGVSECDLSCMARPPAPELLELCDP